MDLPSAAPRRVLLGRLPRAQSFMGRHNRKQKFKFFGLTFWIQKYLAILNKMLNQSLDFSSLINDFASVKARKRLF